tara:strand:- start:1981 stop:4221 length:2241 start_codon:yes stop_codon:yes gene_type:complete
MSDDVLITPASRKIEFKDSGGNVDGTIQLDSSGNLVLTSSVGLLIGDLDADIHIGDGSNVVDMVFDFAGSIYSAANQDLTIGKKSLGGNDILIESPSPVRVSTASGYIDVGPSNSGYAHIQTDRTRFYLNKPLIIDGGNTSGDAYLVSSYSTEDFVIATNNGAEDRITVKQATGNVGIGTTSPLNKLQVDHTGADGDNGIMIVRADTSTASNDMLGGIGFDSTDGNVPSSVLEASVAIIGRAREDHGTGDKGGYLDFYYSPTDQDDDTTSRRGMRMMQGKMSMGGQARDVADPINTLVLYHDASDWHNGMLILRDDTSISDGDLLGAIGFDGKDGNNPSNILEASAGIAAYAAEAHSTGDKGGDLVFFTSAIDDDDDTTSNERLRIDSEGNVGIGTTSPNQPLTIEGTMSLKEQASANSDTAAYGQLWVKTATPNELYFTTDAGDDIQLTSGTSAAGGGGGGAVDSIANFANNRVLTASDADSINGEANLVFDGTNLGIGEDDPANRLEIRGASTAGTHLGHIMLTGDSSTVGQGPQIVFSESGSGSNWAGASIGHVRTGSGSMGDLIFSTRQSSGNANTVPTEMMRLVGGTSPEITMATNISSTSKSAFNLMQKFYFQRSSMGTGTVDLRVPCGGDGSANPNNYPMPRAGKVVALTLHYYGGTIATGVETDVWEIRKYSGGSETTLDVAVIRQTLTNPTGNNYNITVELASPMNVAAGDWLGIRRDVSGGSVTHVSGILYVSFAG